MSATVRQGDLGHSRLFILSAVIVKCSDLFVKGGSVLDSLIGKQSRTPTIFIAFLVSRFFVAKVFMLSQLEQDVSLVSFYSEKRNHSGDRRTSLSIGNTPFVHHRKVFGVLTASVAVSDDPSPAPTFPAQVNDYGACLSKRYGFGKQIAFMFSIGVHPLDSDMPIGVQDTSNIGQQFTFAHT